MATTLTEVPTNKRPFNTVFQDYALFPHMNVAQNVGYGLMLRRMPKAEITRHRYARRSTWSGLSDFPDRYPGRAFRRPAPARSACPRAGLRSAR